MHHNHFNLIRAFAASLVLVSHSFVLSSGDPAREPLRQSLGVTWGSIAVDIFFVTSGYLVTMSLFKRGELRTFVLSRALRIYPGLIVALLLTVGITCFLFSAVGPAEFWSQSQTWRYLVKNAVLVLPGGLEYAINNTLVGVPYQAEGLSPLNGSLWTMPVEIRMYAYLAVGYWVSGLLLRLLPPPPHIDKSTVAKIVLPGVALLGLGADIIQTLRGNHQLQQHMFSMFFVGAALWAVQIDWRNKARFAAAAVVVTVVAALVDRHAFFVVYTLSLPFIVLALAHAYQPALLGYNRIGDYSYGLYIYAFPVQQWCAYAYKGIGTVGMTLAAFVVTLAFAIGSWHLVEKRALALKPRPLAQGSTA